MYSLNRESISEMSAVDIRVVIYGVIGGLIMGATRLGDSVDQATALGLVVAIEISVGLWLGTKIWLLTLRAFTKWLTRWTDSLEKRVVAMKSLLTRTTEAPRAEYPDRRSNSVTTRLAVWCIALTPIGIALLTIGAISAIMDIRFDIHSTVFYLPGLIIGATLAIAGLLPLCVRLFVIECQVRGLENRLDKIESALQSLSWTRDFEKADTWTRSLIAKVVGYRAAA